MQMHSRCGFGTADDFGDLGVIHSFEPGQDKDLGLVPREFAEGFSKAAQQFGGPGAVIGVIAGGQGLFVFGVQHFFLSLFVDIFEGLSDGGSVEVGVPVDRGGEAAAAFPEGQKDLLMDVEGGIIAAADPPGNGQDSAAVFGYQLVKLFVAHVDLPSVFSLL